jgi:hypothetical protein
MKSRIIKELKEHAPFTLLASILGIFLVIIIQFVFSQKIPEESFEIFHSIHILASAIVTAGIFYKYSKKISHSILVGIFGAIIIGSISDIIFPFLGGTLLGLNTKLHLPIFEEPLKIIVFSLGGTLIGVFGKITKIPHFIHVFSSVFASLFYLISFSSTLNLIHLLISILIIFFAVLIPCCISDIIFPLLLLKNKKTS